MAKNEAVNGEALKQIGITNKEGNFIRKGLTLFVINLHVQYCVLFILVYLGKTGDWKNYFDSEMSAKIDEWIAKHLEGTGLSFVTQLDKQD